MPEHISPSSRLDRVRLAIVPRAGTQKTSKTNLFIQQTASARRTRRGAFVKF